MNGVVRKKLTETGHLAAAALNLARHIEAELARLARQDRLWRR